MAMPKTELNYQALDALLQFKVTKKFCADYLQISEDAIDRRIKEDYGINFGEYHSLRMGRTAVKIQQKIVELALKGNPKLLEVAAKYLAGWTEKSDLVISNSDLRVIISKEENAL
jgi:hypothetical protein